jgi:hypothetical protein
MDVILLIIDIVYGVCQIVIKSRDASVILFAMLIDKSPDPSNGLIRIIFYTKVCNIISDAD